MNELLEPFDKMLEAISTPAQIRAVEEGAPVAPVWDELVQSGFLDALVSEDAGGAGLSMADMEPLFEALGRHAVPAPVAETMVARKLLADAGESWLQGPIAMAVAKVGQDVVVPFGMVAEHVLIDLGDGLVLAGAADGRPVPTGVRGSLDARMRWDSEPVGIRLPAVAGGLRPVAAVLRAAAMAGAAGRLLEMTAAYANERVQFGKPIGRQQALQQNMAVMAEDAVACRLAAQLGCGGGVIPALAAAATAKSMTSAAAGRIAATAHAVHGAIGISEEYDLQLYTRRLYEWRLADGSEGYWNRLLGQARLASKQGSVDWVRGEVFA
ncbi:MAG: acyl-CoA dehydrogenase [Novosphingobium sp.]|nr:acyl-CoA dehydrogenase [Novosphingobium sp.]